MEIDGAQFASTDDAPPTLEHSMERLESDSVAPRDVPDAPSGPKVLHVVGRAFAALARWLLVILLVMVAPVGLTVWSVIPRVASPLQLADAAIESGWTKTVRVTLIEQLSTELAKQDASRFTANELVPVIERNLSQIWLDEQLTGLAGELDRWLGASTDELPNLVIDLTAVKDSLAADEQALPLIAKALDCTGPRCTSPESALDDVLSEVPNEVAILAIEGDSDNDAGVEVLTARDRLQTVARIIAMIPLVLVGVLAIVVALARRGLRLRWLGATLIAVSIPLFAAATLLPQWAARRAAGSVPDEIPFNRTSLGGVFNWAMRPAGAVALWLLLGGVAAIAGAIFLRVRRHRTEFEPGLEVR